jgi:predicted enzyme related to lactoylglutathione lyase
MRCEVEFKRLTSDLWLLTSALLGAGYTFNRTTVSGASYGFRLDGPLPGGKVRGMIKQIKFASIPVRDQARALDFYTEKLGFTIITDQPFGKQRWIELRIPKAETRVVLFTPEGQEDRIGTFTGISFACDDVEETYQELHKRGVAFDEPPKKQPWGTFATFKDPEGNGFVLSTAK